MLTEHQAASTTVAASSALSRIGAAAFARARPATSSTGPTAPPKTTAAAAGRHSARSTGTGGGWRIVAGAAAIAAPTYNSPASVNAGTEPANCDASSAEAPNSTAANKHRTTPTRLTKDSVATHARRSHRSGDVGPYSIPPFGFDDGDSHNWRHDDECSDR